MALSGLYGPPPSDLHALLALLNELSAARGHGVKRPTAKAYLTGIEGSGKTATLAKQLLAR
jgi:signal recognition particle GTPase